MLFKNIKPITNSQRNLKLLDKSNLSKVKPLKSKTLGLSFSGGRNNLGRITSFRKGGGHKRRYRKIDFIRKKLNGIVLSVEHDPNRSSFIASVYDFQKKRGFLYTCSSRIECGRFNKIRSFC